MMERWTNGEMTDYDICEIGDDGFERLIDKIVGKHNISANADMYASLSANKNNIDKLSEDDSGIVNKEKMEIVILTCINVYNYGVFHGKFSVIDYMLNGLQESK